MTNPLKSAQASFTKAYPLIALHLAGSVVAYVVTLLVTRHVVTNTQASVLSQQLLPLVAAAFVAALGFIGTKLVYPVFAFLERIEAEVQKRLLLAAGGTPGAPAVVTTLPAVPAIPAQSVSTDLGAAVAALSTPVQP